MAWDVERWGALPEAGGIYDQDSVLMQRMRALSNVHSAVATLRGFTGTKESVHAIHKMPRSARRLLKYLQDEGLL